MAIKPIQLRPKEMAVLNGFDKGLNTKSSPRDIAPNELQKADNVIVGYPGLVKSSSTATAKVGSALALTHTTDGNGGFIFNSQHNLDLSGTVTQPVQVIAYPTQNTTANTTIEFMTRNFGSTGNFTFLDGVQSSKQIDNSTDNELDGGINSSVTNIDVDDVDVFNVGDFIKVNSEIMEITGIDLPNTEIDVTRAVKGTSAASHSDEDTINEIDPSINMKTTNEVEPVYYFIDGVLYVSDKKVVDGTNSSSPKAFQYINEERFSMTTIAEWIDTDAAVSTTTDAIFENLAVAGESLSQPSLAGEFRMTLAQFDSYSSTANVTSDGSNAVTLDGSIEFNVTTLTVQASSGTATNNLDTGTIFYIGNEAMQVDNKISATQIQVSRNILGSAHDLDHADDANLYTTTEESIVGGGWEEGDYEFTYSLINYTGDESSLHIFSTELASATIGSGKYFSDVGIQMNITGAFRKREKGLRIYTRKKGSNDRYIIFLDIDYKRGIRKNLFEKYTAWTVSGTYGDASSAYAKVESIKIKNPSLDTFEALTGFSQDEESISFGSDGGYKAATIAMRRAWVANVRKNDKVYDDRIYYSLPNRFATFPDSFYLDIGINDGDSFTALHNLGNFLLAFKQKKLYVINVSSTSDAGWYIEGEYEGMGCINQESVTKTPFGVCWVNNSGVFMFDGQSTPSELTAKLDDKLWYDGQVLSSAQNKPAIGYNNKYKQLLVMQDSACATNGNVETEADIFVFDFNTQSWTTTDGLFNLLSTSGATGISNFMESFDGVFYLERESSANKVLGLFTGDYGTNSVDFRTKDIDFGNPGRVKKIFRVYVTARDAAANTTLTLSYALDGSTSYTALTGQAVNNANYQVKTFSIDKNCESISLKLVSNGKIEINDITIEYRATRKRPS
jgi:hypothetical protein